MGKTITEIRQFKAEMDKRIADFITEEVATFEVESGVSVVSVHSGFHKVRFSDEGKASRARLILECKKVTHFCFFARHKYIMFSCLFTASL